MYPGRRMTGWREAALIEERVVLGKRSGRVEMPMRFFMVLAMVLMIRAVCADQTAVPRQSYDSHGKSNPFIPPPPAAKGSGGEEEDVDTSALEAWFSQNLNGVIWDEENPYVLIKDDIVPVGGEVRGCTIVEIKPDGIVFLYGKKRVGVPLREQANEEKKQGEK